MAEYISNEILLTVLSKASDEERLALSKILDHKAIAPLAPELLRAKIGIAGGHGVFNMLRGNGISYAELLHDACSTIKVDKLRGLQAHVHAGLSLSAIDWMGSTAAKSVPQDTRNGVTLVSVDTYERSLLSQISVVMYERMTPDQRRKVDAQVAELSKNLDLNSLKGLTSSAALLVIGNLGGFATYTLVSTILGTLSMGTLGFGAYTLASSMLSVVLGPVGWLALSGYAVYKFGGPDAGKVLQLAATCAMIDQRLRGSRANSQLHGK